MPTPAEKVLLFEDPLDLRDFVRIHEGEMEESTEAFQLDHVEHPHRPGRSALLLGGWRVSPKDDPSPGVPLDLDVRTDTELQIAGVRIGIRSTRRSCSLVALIGLTPEPLPEEIGEVLFVASPDQPELQTILRDSLALGNDQIRFASMGAEDRSGDFALVRIQNPSYFLVQRSIEEGAVEAYLPGAAPGHWVPAGWGHPLSDFWKTDEHSFLLFGEDGTVRKSEPPTWEDGYGLVDLALADLEGEDLVVRSEEPFRVDIGVRLAPSADLAEPELWLLDQEGVAELEALLQLLHEEEIRPFQLAAVTREKSEEKNPLFFLRKASVRKKQSAERFRGQAFARFQGLPNLFLPVEQTLHPPLRRDHYPRLFELVSGVVTVLLPTGAEGGYELIRIPEPVFGSLRGYIDYRMEQEGEQIAKKMEATRFDLGPYLTAPRRPDLLQPSSEKKTAPRSSKPEENEAVAKAKRVPKIRRSGYSILGNTREGEEEAVPDPEGLQAMEIELERALLDQGQESDAWFRLCEVKARLEKFDEAFLCATEACWVDPGSHERLDDLGVAALRLSEARGKGETPTTMAAELFLDLRQVPNEEAGSQILDGWIADRVSELNQRESALRAKERWLWWGEVLRINRDVRTETRIRGEIRDRIADQGLALVEVPAFLRHRLFLDGRTLPTSSDEETPQGAAAALENLEVLAQAVPRISAGRFRQTLLAALSRAFAIVGDHARAADLFDVGERVGDPCADSWVLLYQSEAFRESQPEQSARLRGELDRVLSDLDDPSSEPIRELADLFARKARAEDLAGLLSEVNWKRSYPTGGSQDECRLRQMTVRYATLQQSGDQRAAVEALRGMLSLDGDVLDDQVQLPQFARAIIEGLELHRWGDGGAGLVGLYENFSDRASRALKGGDDFYRAMLHSTLAYGLVAFDLLEPADEELERAVDHACQTATEGDFIDAAAAVYKVVEQLPLERRGPHLHRLLERQIQVFGPGKNSYTTTSRLFSVYLAPLVQQSVEAAMGRDRVTLQQFRKYRMEDEYLVLQRIQNETFCADPTTNES